MGFLKFFGKEKGEGDFSEMSKKKKKAFLSNDFINRMIRVEQNVAFSFGEKKPYNKTQHYKSLTSFEKENYNKYLKRKQSNLGKFLIFFILMIMVIFLFNYNITGNAVSEVVGAESLSWLSLIFLVLFVAVVLIAGLMFLQAHRTKRRFESHFDVLNNVRFKREVAEAKI